jgi:RNA polymerase sigma-70 factor (ECF subfamily)
MMRGQDASLSTPLTSAAPGAATADDLAACFAGCRDRCHAVALQITGDVEEAADLVQEAFLRASRKLGGFRGQSSLETWLLRIVVNLALKALRRRRVRQRLRHLVPLPQPRPAADWLLDCDRQSRRLARAMDRLPARQRAAFVLRHAHDLPVAEVARLMDVSVGTVKTHLLRAAERLRRELRRWDEHQPL